VEWSAHEVPKTRNGCGREGQDILAHYVEPGPRDCETTINQLMDVLDDTSCTCGAGLPCECNTGDEPDISQIIEEKKPTRQYSCRPNL
jgi:hypothetical protein